MYNVDASKECMCVSVHRLDFNEIFKDKKRQIQQWYSKSVIMLPIVAVEAIMTL